MLINENGRLNDDERYRVTLRNKSSEIIINCSEFKTFESLVDVSKVILEKENQKEKEENIDNE